MSPSMGTASSEPAPPRLEEGERGAWQVFSLSKITFGKGKENIILLRLYVNVLLDTLYFMKS